MKNYIFEKMSEIDSKYIEESINYRCNIGSRGALKRKMFLVAAIVTLIGCMAVAVPLMRTWDSGIDKVGYDFNSPEFEDFKIEGT
ncbi:MAG: hypothetical protein U0M06_04870, partial [Clostridia bacterium]|nr:hypothetical protein [Clostridia bacterium]